jgi:hypothetical protein
MGVVNWTSSEHCQPVVNWLCVIADALIIVALWNKEPSHERMLWFAFMVWHAAENLRQAIRKLP